MIHRCHGSYGNSSIDELCMNRRYIEDKRESGQEGVGKDAREVGRKILS